ncbi:MAG: cobalamin-dependent protein [Dethiobacteria bacterium]|jgi:methanogenic corrinoid protein MtbC1|nr:hypothetical protein [Bacillota bacterium]HOP69748.1 cobalamin-dependent protein [Bacillota bacterium]HPT34621.1 cobalamin-dependent protein [Bacillota bacterium]HPZ65763.1 cobalamin-dependent protein [Bacillota bacterium]
MKKFERLPLIGKMLLELDEEGVLSLVREALQEGASPLEILEECQKGMTGVGIRYEQHDYYLSGLMMAGEIFRQVMELTEPHLCHYFYGRENGHILLGTVQGDIHDIGKNMFSTMARCHGFTITDLGVDVPPEAFREAAEEINPDIIGLSGLLTVAFDAMQQTVHTLRQSRVARVARTPVIIGGSLLNAQVCAYVGADYWCVDAVVGIKLCQEILNKGLSTS